MKKLALYSLLFLVSVQTWAMASVGVCSFHNEPIKLVEWDAKIYPNPNNGEFSIMVVDNRAAIKVVVFNVIGEKVYQMTAIGDHQLKIDLTSVEKGLYFVQFVDESKGEVLTRRMYIE